MEGQNFGLKSNNLDLEKSSAQNDLGSLLREKGIENVPKIETNFFFHKHATAENGQAVGERLKNADILIQENAGWDSARLDIFNEVSNGTLTPEQAMDMEKQNGKPFLWKDFYASLLEGLYKSEKKVMLVDVPNDNVVFKNLMGLYASNGAYNNLINKSLPYEETLRRIGNVSKFESDMQKAREDYILEKLPEALAETLKQNPDLQKKENLKILFSMGGFHTRLYHEMKKSGNDVSREFSSMPYNFDPRMATERNIHFKGMEESKYLLPKIALYLLLKKELPNLKITHDVISVFSDEEIKSLYEKYQTASSEEFKEYFESIL
ncbi:MAG: hypothetical protein HGB03_03280 [Candidatus Yonathbacteria bacterium]|nr:hypothetical protein [Candidatus Yonathbacteria bacterium]NTW47347.1 hypothetical protein [Candidatus Yonathbacteria bacterium]